MRAFGFNLSLDEFGIEIVQLLNEVQSYKEKFVILTNKLTELTKFMASLPELTVALEALKIAVQEETKKAAEREMYLVSEVKALEEKVNVLQAKLAEPAPEADYTKEVEMVKELTKAVEAMIPELEVSEVEAAVIE